jgi:hypothetical protein
MSNTIFFRSDSKEKKLAGGLPCCRRLRKTGSLRSSHKAHVSPVDDYRRHEWSTPSEIEKMSGNQGFRGKKVFGVPLGEAAGLASFSFWPGTADSPFATPASSFDNWLAGCRSQASQAIDTVMINTRYFFMKFSRLDHTKGTKVTKEKLPVHRSPFAVRRRRRKDRRPISKRQTASGERWNGGTVERRTANGER